MKTGVMIALVAMAATAASPPRDRLDKKNIELPIQYDTNYPALGCGNSKPTVSCTAYSTLCTKDAQVQPGKNDWCNDYCHCVRTESPQKNAPAGTESIDDVSSQQVHQPQNHVRDSPLQLQCWSPEGGNATTSYCQQAGAFCSPDGDVTGSIEGHCYTFCHCKPNTTANATTTTSQPTTTTTHATASSLVLPTDHNIPPRRGRGKRQGFEPGPDSNYPVDDLQLKCGEMTVGCSKYVHCLADGEIVGSGDESGFCKEVCHCEGTRALPK
ncbi:Uu.00g129230.m01.CDS01 [Anthostomella pinea]|uniref:Uu.00g129230.m01.CDS01 n=1 Tax=Anthostomella pinea TaxID=933095 RepID=A0AAI8VJK7_9PEZI|nr:Uu.00g129230.m01.CDS01 [Anthostomella pinea]